MFLTIQLAEHAWGGRILRSLDETSDSSWMAPDNGSPVIWMLDATMLSLLIVCSP